MRKHLIRLLGFAAVVLVNGTLVGRARGEPICYECGHNGKGYTCDEVSQGHSYCVPVDIGCIVKSKDCKKVV